MKDLSALRTGPLVQGSLDEDRSEAISKEDEFNPRLSHPQEGERFRVPSVHCRSGSSVPFKWEETPGKAKASCRGMSMSRKDLQLQLPPRLQFSNSSEMRRITRQTPSKGPKMRIRQLNRRHSMVVDSRKRIGQMKSYVRSITLQPRVIRCVIARKNSEILEAAPAGGFSGRISPADKPNSVPDSPETDIGAISTASSTSSWCPDLSPDGDDYGGDHKTRRKVAMERVVRFMSSWVAKKTKNNEAEMWSPTLATYLYNTRRDEAGATASKAENWAAVGRLKEEEEEGDGGEVATEEDNCSSSLDDSVAQKSSSPQETDSSTAAGELSRPRLVFTLAKTVRLLLSPLHSSAERRTSGLPLLSNYVNSVKPIPP